MDVVVRRSPDLSTLASIPWVAYGDAASDTEVFRAKGVETLVEAQLQVSAALTADSTHYWSMTLRHRRAGQTFGELVGLYETDDRSLVALEPVTLYSSENVGLAMADDERLVLYITESGIPLQQLEDLTLWLRMRRKAR